MDLVTASQMRAMDKAAIEEYGIPGIVLMENAALRVVEAMEARYAPLAGKNIAVVCGKGNNGGDGLAIGRHLAVRFGATVSICLATADTLTGDAHTNYEMARKFGLDFQSPENLPEVLQRANIIVDALLGTGIKGGVTGDLAKLIEAINAAGKPIVAVDVPSGLEADTGHIEGACIQANLTVTFALAKIGLIDYPGASAVGELIVADIGMPRQAYPRDVRVTATEAGDVARWIPARPEDRDSNKGTYGTVVLCAGSRGLIGAAVLCAEAAARTGAGLVTLAVPQEAQAAVMGRVNPVIMTRGMPETKAGTFAAKALDDALTLARKAKAAAIGPGLGGTADDETRTFAREFIRQCPVPLVIDADALNILGLEEDQGASIVRSRTAATILTPHPGEMGRLLGLETNVVQSDRRKSVEQAVAVYECVVLLKGARTLIAAPNKTLRINTTGNAGMANGGMGDTLTGILTALLAGGLSAAETAAAGAYLHGLAGDLVVQEHGGKAGLIATDLIEMLPRALAECQKDRISCRDL